MWWSIVKHSTLEKRPSGYGSLVASPWVTVTDVAELGAQPPAIAARRARAR